MKKLNELDEKRIKGGGLSIAAIFGIGSLVTFIVGIFDGIARPLKCR